MTDDEARALLYEELRKRDRVWGKKYLEPIVLTEETQSVGSSVRSAIGPGCFRVLPSQDKA